MKTMPKLPYFTFNQLLFDKGFIEKIKNPRQKAAFEKYNLLNLELRKQINYYHLLITDPELIIPEKRFTQKAAEIDSNLNVTNEKFKELPLNSIIFPRSFWNYLSTTVSDYTQEIANRFGGEVKQFSPLAKPHANLMNINQGLLIFFGAIGINFIMLPPLVGLTVAFAIITALLITSIIMTALSIISYYKKDHTLEKNTFEQSILVLEQALDKRALDLEKIGQSIDGLVDQIEKGHIKEFFKDDVVCSKHVKAKHVKAKDLNQPHTEKNSNPAAKASQTGMFKPTEEKDKEEAIKQLNKFNLLNF